MNAEYALPGAVNFSLKLVGALELDMSSLLEDDKLRKDCRCRIVACGREGNVFPSPSLAGTYVDDGLEPEKMENRGPGTNVEVARGVGVAERLECP